jgi:hypothetical protein
MKNHREMLRLRAIPAQLAAEKLIAEKFGKQVDHTGIFFGVTSPAIKEEVERQEALWSAWEAEQAEPVPPSLWSRIASFFTRRAS